MLLKADHVDFFVVENESESLYLESNLIKKHLPPFNNLSIRQKILTQNGCSFHFLLTNY